MNQLTRRGVFGVLGGTVGLAACGGASEGGAKLGSFEGTVAFEHGVASGDPLPDRMVFWTRVTRKSATTDDIPVLLEILEDGALVQSHILSAKRSADDTVKFDAEGLTPGTVYTYQFKVMSSDGEVASPTGRTKTTKSGGSDEVKISFISCSNYPFGFFNVYKAIGKRDDLDAVIHLGDYLYEYGPDGYGGEVGAQIGRPHAPAKEIVLLEDYRERHAQYKADPDLQAAHAAAPWITTWDDHESANNSYRTGAQNHQSDSEGSWTDRKQIAVQAYLEWMPVRDPEPGKARAALWRTFTFGNVATVHALESRLTGRSDEISWSTELDGVAPADVPTKAAEVMARVNDPSRTMLGEEQENWLAEELRSSVEASKTWQVLANQIVMARVVPPNLNATLTDEQKAQVTNPFVQPLIGFTALQLPFNLDAWDGFPAARERLYASAKEAGARLVTLTGDTHTGWANSLTDASGELRGVEFGCTSVTSPGMGTLLPFEDLGEQFSDNNAEVDWHDPFGSGYTLLTLNDKEVRAEFLKVDTVLQPSETVTSEATFRTTVYDDTLTALERL